jgi:hypothetical protein
MPKVEGAGIVLTGGPGHSARGPLYVKGAALPGQPAAQFNYVQYMDANGYWALQVANITIPTASVITLHSVPFNLATPAPLLGAPGAGLAIVLDFVIAELKYNSATYAAGGALSITYGSAGGAAHATAVPAALVTAAQTEVFFTPGGLTAQLAASAVVNTGLFISAATQDFTTGNSPLLLTIGFRIMGGF